MDEFIGKCPKCQKMTMGAVKNGLQCSSCGYQLMKKQAFEEMMKRTFEESEKKGENEIIVQNKSEALMGKLADSTNFMLSVIPFAIIVMLFVFITIIGFCDIFGQNFLGQVSMDTTRKVLFYFFLLFGLTDFLSLLFYSNILPLILHNKRSHGGYLESVLLLGLIIILYEAFQKYILSTDTNIALVIVSLGILLIAISIFSRYRYRT